MNRSKTVKAVLWLLTGMAAVVALSRFTRGLGATTALTDSTPWGFWIGFDVMAGVALAAGGFVLAATVYIFRLERFRPLLRATVLTAFLGYVAVAVGLLFDLGVPWHIWHPMVYWQYHSVLFEVAWCVIVYLNVLGLEFAPVALEHKLAQWWPLNLIYKILKTLTVPLVILGIMLSTLHQSSLGSLFLIMPSRVHPLWYSPWLPPLYFVSAIGLGLMMVSLENFVSGWVYRHHPRLDLLSSLGGAAAVVLGLYAALRVYDLFHRGILPGGLDGSWQSGMFIFELGISAVVPALVLAVPRLRRNATVLFVCAVMVVAGMVLYRLDISVVTMKRWPGTHYFPSLFEFMVSIGIVSGLMLVFIFCVEHFQVFEEAVQKEEERELVSADAAVAAAGDKPPRGVVLGTIERALAFWLHDWPPFRRIELSGDRIWVGDPFRGTIRKYSLLFLLAAAVTVAVIPGQAIFGFQYQADPVEPARLVPAAAGDVLAIDGNRSGEAVLFPHEAHKQRTGGKPGCVVCHHLSQPKDFATPCADCHADMYQPSSIFDHEHHQDLYHGNDGCITCHPVDKDPLNAKTCQSCHPEMWAQVPAGERVNFMARSYQDAMHGRCVACHEAQGPLVGRPDLPVCTTCHK